MIRTAEEFLALRFSDDPAEYNRAAREEAPMEVWLTLIRDHPESHFWIAHNKTIPVEILRILAGNDDSRVRSMVAMKHKTTADILRQLATDGHDAIRASVAGHRNTPDDVLIALCSDPWDEIRKAARANLDRRGHH